MNGKLYGVSVGPGDPELITIKALNRIKTSDIIFAPGKSKENSKAYNIARKAYNDIDEKKIEIIDWPMTRDRDILNSCYIDCADKICKYLRSGLDVSFLTIGDISIYSTFIYIKNIVEEKGYECNMIAGVPSFCAAASSMGTELVTKDEKLYILPATNDLQDDLRKVSACKVIMKPSALGDVKKLLKDGNFKDVSLIVNAGTQDEEIYKNISEFPDKIPYLSLIIVK